jgi:hypothetical protein
MRKSLFDREIVVENTLKAETSIGKHLFQRIFFLLVSFAYNFAFKKELLYNSCAYEKMSWEMELTDEKLEDLYSWVDTVCIFQRIYHFDVREMLTSFWPI